MKKLILILALTLGGCATVEALGTPENYGKCLAVDVVTTAYTLSVGAVEQNPLTKALFVKGVGKVMGTVIPVIGLGVLTYYFLKWLDEPVVTAAATTATCYVGLRNLYRLP